MTLKPDDLKLKVNMLKGATCGIVEDPLRPGGLQWVDMWLDSIAKPSGPTQTTRFRMTVEHLNELMDRLVETRQKLRLDDAGKPRH